MSAAWCGPSRSSRSCTTCRRRPQTVGILLLLRAFASGCSALTGVEAIANAVPSFRKPRYRRAQHTEMWLGILLGAMLIGLAILIRKFEVGPVPERDRRSRS